MSNSTETAFNPDLMARYGQSGPRYTSYPTALQFSDYFADELQRLVPLQADGLSERIDASILLTPTGRLMMRTVAMAFDAYLEREAESAAMSRVI